MTRVLLRVCLLAVGLATLSTAGAPPQAEAQYFISPDAGRVQTYKLLRRDPWKAVGYDALFPGAGSLYVGVELWGNAAISAVASLVGAALWVHGGIKDDDTTYWTGVGLFAAGRAYGLASAGLGAYLLNRALKRQLSIGLSLQGLRLRF